MIRPEARGGLAVGLRGCLGDSGRHVRVSVTGSGLKVPTGADRPRLTRWVLGRKGSVGAGGRVKRHRMDPKHGFDPQEAAKQDLGVHMGARRMGQS